MSIHFGTDGWRAVISDEFTFENVRRVAQAIADWVGESNGHSSPTMVVGFDTRFLSDRYAIEVSRVLAANGITVYLTQADAPTPVVSFAVKHLGARGGVMITASHNPPRYNGIKLKAAFGGSASGEDGRRVEYYLDRGVEIQPLEYEAAQNRGLIRRFDPAAAYNAHLETLISREVIASRPSRVVVDPMYGAGRDYIAAWLKDTGWQVTQIRGEMNPGFGGIHPEPIMPHLEALRRAVVVREGTPDLNLFILRTWLSAKLNLQDERGANLVEYILLVLFIAIIAIVAVSLFGNNVSSKFNSAANSMG
jgi:phosphomannomutase/Flp pilus assembly pilin Flp